MKKNNNTEKLIHYLIGIKPDEFLLVPDSNGFIKLKDLLKAVHETKDLRWITKTKIIHCANNSESRLEIKDNLIRSKEREKITRRKEVLKAPGELYIAIRQKAWPNIHDKGLYPENREIILSNKKEIAQKLGKRKDQSPILLTINTKIALKTNTKFQAFGENIFIASHLVPKSINGPDPEKLSIPKKQKKIPEKKEAITPGSFTPDILTLFPGQHENQAKKSWKNNKKRLRRTKKSMWPDQ